MHKPLNFSWIIKDSFQVKELRKKNDKEIGLGERWKLFAQILLQSIRCFMHNNLFSNSNTIYSIIINDSYYFIYKQEENYIWKTIIIIYTGCF